MYTLGHIGRSKMTTDDNLERLKPPLHTRAPPGSAALLPWPDGVVGNATAPIPKAVQSRNVHH